MGETPAELKIYRSYAQLVNALQDAANGLYAGVVDVNAVSKVYEINGVGNKDSGFVGEVSEDQVVNDFAADVGVKSRDGIVHEQNVFVSINSSCQTDSGLLSSTQVDSLFSDFSEVSSWEDVKISFELAHLNRLDILCLV